MNLNQTYLIAQQKLRHYCSYQERNITEVQSKLEQYKDLTAAQIEQIMQELIQENFLDEKRYIAAFVNGKFFIKKWGKSKIYHALVSKNIQPNLFRQTLESIPEEAYQQTLRDLIHKKKATLSPHNKADIQKKIINYLLQKGYEHELIQVNLQAILQT